MSEDKQGAAQLLAACRTFIVELAAEAQAAFRACLAQLVQEVTAAARHALISLAVLAGMLLLALTAAVACTAVGIVLGTRGVHALIAMLVRCGWLADLITGFILLALPWAALGLARWLAQPATKGPPPPPPVPGGS